MVPSEPLAIGSVVYLQDLDGYTAHAVKVSSTQWIDVETGTDGFEGASSVDWTTLCLWGKVSLTPHLGQEAVV